MKKYDYITSCVMLAISGYVFYETSGYQVGNSAQKNPALWPQVLAFLLAFLAVALLVQTIFRPKSADDTDIDWKSPGMKKVYLTMALCVAFVIVMNIFGMLIALFLMIPAVEWLMGCRSRVMLIALPVGLVAFVYVFFCVIMKINLPAPFWA